MKNQSSFGSLLKQYRQAAGLTQEDLAEQAGLSTRAISDLERGINRSPRRATLKLLAAALSLSESQRELLISAARPGVRANSRPAAIPISPTRLIGRESELKQALLWLGSGKTRLLTLTGPSGVGKTRLALQLAQELEPDFSDRAVFVPLEHIHQSDLVPAALAQVLGIHESPSITFQEQVRDHLRDKHILLVLDNLEQILDCSPFIASLLSACPRLAVLATSRSPLRLRAEQELLLAPLTLENAVELFGERAKAVRPEAEFSPDEIALICEQLDCLPLAIELAAPQVRLLSFPDLRKRLSHHFSLLRNGARDLPARQQTMEAALAWSYALLTDSQQRCFRALGVFVGRFTLEAAEAVLQIESTAQEDLTLILSALVESSLIQTEGLAGGTVHLSMFVLMREYARERLRSSNEMEMVQRRHAVYYARLADSAMAIFESGQPSPDLSLAKELPNVQAALEWAEDNHEAELGIQLCGFCRLWHVLGQPGQAAYWLTKMLTLDRWARENGRPAAQLTQRVGKLYSLGRVLIALGKMDQAEAAAQEALNLADRAGDTTGASSAWATLGMIAQAGGRLDEARRDFLKAAQYAEKAGDDKLYYRTLFHLGELSRGQGEFSQAAEYLEQALTRAQHRKMNWDVAMLASLLGRLAYQMQNDSLAEEYFHQSLELLRTFGSPTYIAWCLEGLASVLISEGRAADAARFCAAAVNLRRQAGTPLPGQEAETFEQIIARARYKLGPKKFHREWEFGARLSQDKVVEMALGDRLA